MKPKFYYERDEGRRPVVTVCEINTDQGLAIGRAICNPVDAPTKRMGRRIAEARAQMAYMERTTKLFKDSRIARMEFIPV